MSLTDRTARFQVRRSVNAVEDLERAVLIGSNHRNFVEISIGDDRIADALDMLVSGATMGAIIDSFKGDGELALQFEKILMTLMARGLVEQLDEEKSDLGRFDRQILYFRDVMNIGLKEAKKVQEKIGSFRIGLLGVGGVGSYVARTLSSMGFGQIAILDFDVVEESNISRQIFYDYRDLGRPKVDVVKEKIAHISPNTRVVTFCKSVQTLSDVKCVAEISDLIVCAIDTPRPQIYELISRIPFEFNVPTIYGGSAADNVSIGPTVIPGHSRCVKCVRGVNLRLEPRAHFAFVDKIKSGYTTTLIDPINAYAAATMSLEAVKTATGCSTPMLDRSIFVNLSSYTTTQYDALAAGTSCGVCGGRLKYSGGQATAARSDLP
ncbi:ThiF family adenylyltransferase [Rhizobium ruizarguesonis]